jgi:hypothetical protein
MPTKRGSARALVTATTTPGKAATIPGRDTYPGQAPSKVLGTGRKYSGAGIENGPHNPAASLCQQVLYACTARSSLMYLLYNPEYNHGCRQTEQADRRVSKS